MQAPWWDTHRCSLAENREAWTMVLWTVWLSPMTSNIFRDWWCFLFCLVSLSTLATLQTVASQAFLSMGILQSTVLEWVAMPFSRGIFPTQGWKPGLLHCRWILYQLSHLSSSNGFFQWLPSIFNWSWGSFMCLEMYFYLIIISEFQNTKNQQKTWHIESPSML